MMAKLQRIDILMVTDLGDFESEMIGFNKISMDRAKTLVKNAVGSVAAIPHANLLVKTTG